MFKRSTLVLVMQSTKLSLFLLLPFISRNACPGVSVCPSRSQMNSCSVLCASSCKLVMKREREKIRSQIKWQNEMKRKIQNQSTVLFSPFTLGLPVESCQMEPAKVAIFSLLYSPLSFVTQNCHTRGKSQEPQK